VRLIRDLRASPQGHNTADATWLLFFLASYAETESVQFGLEGIWRDWNFDGPISTRKEQKLT
jgi:hypothetical protein